MIQRFKCRVSPCEDKEMSMDPWTLQYCQGDVPPVALNPPVKCHGVVFSSRDRAVRSLTEGWRI